VPVNVGPAALGGRGPAAWRRAGRHWHGRICFGRLARAGHRHP